MQKKSWIIFSSILGIVLISAFVLGAKPGDNQDNLLQLILDELTEIKTIANGMTILLQEINSKNETINVNVEAPPITIQEDNSMTKRGNILVQNLDNSKQIPFYVSLPNGNCSIMLSTDEVITNTLENVVWNNDKITNKSKFLEDLKNSAGNNYKQLDKLAEVAEAVSQISKNGERNIFFKTLPNGDKYFIGDSANVDAWTQGELGTNQDNSEEFSEESEEDNTSSDNARLKKVKTSRGDEVWR